MPIDGEAIVAQAYVEALTALGHTISLDDMIRKITDAPDHEMYEMIEGK